MVPHKRQDPFKNMWYVYIIQSTSNQGYYAGVTKDLQERLSRHNSGRSRYTKNRGPWIYRHTEPFKDLPSARKREFFIKKQKSKRFIESLIAG
ncbi:MAG: hypothetical protein FJZ15_06435 [Candidatus Omnitrophica bacterium]|nr:hypothetical protein [Candidatus Omnitrophota bacterium]